MTFVGYCYYIDQLRRLLELRDLSLAPTWSRSTTLPANPSDRKDQVDLRYDRMSDTLRLAFTITLKAEKHERQPFRRCPRTRLRGPRT